MDAPEGAPELDVDGAPVTPHANALDGFHPRDEELKYAFRNGVTSVSARMGSENVHESGALVSQSERFTF